MTFGEYIAKLRRERGLTLRQFCAQHDYDPGNHSKMERGFLAPYEDKERLTALARDLGLKSGSDGFLMFFDLAHVARRVLPIQNIKDEAVLQKLPVLFRAVDRNDLTEKELDDLIELIKKN